MIDQNWLELTDYLYNKKVKATFSYKNIHSKPFQNVEEFSQMCGFDSDLLAIPNQTHSTNVKKISNKGYFANTDGLFTSNQSIICTIQVADCLPVFFSHNFRFFCGLVHIGWRGLVNGILSESVELIIYNGFSNEDFQVMIGPSIQSCCFEVSSDLVNSFDANFVKKKFNGKYSVDLQGILKDRLKFYGFLNQNINVIEECTFCDNDKYFSYRREGNQAGRMYGLIGKKCN